MTRWLGRIILISVFGALLLTPLAARAVETLSPEALSIANQLNCPVCEGLSVRDSTSQLSGQMRQEIQNRLNQGQTPKQIINYFVSVYGVSILRDPPKHGFILTLWWGPVIGIVVGLVLLGAFLLQKRMRMTRVGASGGPVPIDSLATDRDLERFEARFRRELDKESLGDTGIRRPERSADDASLPGHAERSAETGSVSRHSERRAIEGATSGQDDRKLEGQAVRHVRDAAGDDGDRLGATLPSSGTDAGDVRTKN